MLGFALASAGPKLLGVGGEWVEADMMKPGILPSPSLGWSSGRSVSHQAPKGQGKPWDAGEESVVSSETLCRLCGSRLEGSRCVALSVEVLKVGGSE